MESKLGKCPFFRSTPGCVPEALCALTGKSRTSLDEGLSMKPTGCLYPLITNNNCEVEKMPSFVIVEKNIEPTLIEQKREIVFSDCS